MKNTQLLSLGVLLSAGFLLTACSNDDGVSDDSPVESTWTLTVKATKGGNEATTRVLKPGETGDKTLYATWATTENVYVYYKEVNGSYTEHGVLHPNANDYWATLSGNLTGFADKFITDNSINGFEITLQFPRKGDATWVGQNGTLADISQNFDWATATAMVRPVDNNNKILAATTSADFKSLQAIVRFTLLKKVDSNNATSLPSNPTALTVSYGESDIATLTSIPTETYTTNGDGILYVAIPGFEDKTVTLTATVGSDTYTYTKSNATFTNGKYYDITVKMTQQQ